MSYAIAISDGEIIKIEQIDAFVDETGNFSQKVTLVKGLNSLEISAIDIAGNTTLISVDIDYYTLIKLTIGSNKAFINNEEKTLDAPPYIKKGRTFVPLRFISEALGAEVNWDAANKEITITKEGKVIRMRIGSTDVFVKDLGETGETKYVLEAPPEIVGGRTFVPIRFIAEQFDIHVDWNQTTKVITLDSSL